MMRRTTKSPPFIIFSLVWGAKIFAAQSFKTHHEEVSAVESGNRDEVHEAHGDADERNEVDHGAKTRAHGGARRLRDPTGPAI